MGVQGQTYTHKLGICCHEPIGSQMLNWKETLGEEGITVLKGELRDGHQQSPAGDHLQPSVRNLG